MTENPSLITQGTSQFPTYGSAVVVERKFLPLKATLCFASHGRNCLSATPAKPCVGHWNVPFVTFDVFKILFPFPPAEGIRSIPTFLFGTLGGITNSYFLIL